MKPGSQWMQVSALCIAMLWSRDANAQTEAEAPPEPAAPIEAEAPPEEAPPVAAEGSMTFDANATLDGETALVTDDSAVDDDSHLILGAKFGGALPFSDLGLGPIVAIEAGWVFGNTSGQLAALLDFSYMVSTAEGDAPDMRVPAATYHWKLTQKELVLQPTFLFRLTGVSETLVPYVGLGPRIYMLEGVTEGKAGTEQLGETFERSTTVGLGVPFGLEWTMGPGGLLLEILLQWGPLTHETTGDSNLGSAALWLGYRAIL